MSITSLSLWLCQILTDFQNFCTAGKRMKLAAKNTWHYPPHLRHVATLPWEIKNSNFLQIFSKYGRKCKQIAFWVHRWIPVSRDISRTVLWVCGLFSWFKTKSLTVSMFSSVWALHALPLPSRLTMPVSRNFFKGLLTPRFVQLFSGNSSVNLCCVLLQIQTFYQNLVLVAEYHVDCWQTLQWCLLWRIWEPQIDRKSK